MSRHTAGPWYEGCGNGYGHIFADHNGRMKYENGTVLYPIASIVTGCNEEEDDANSRLIATAPELFASLATLVEWMREHTGPADGTVEMLRNAVAIIAKAKGEN